jgi:hypothetical protein
MFIEAILVIFGALVAVTIVLYGTWLLAHRLRRNESKPKAFGEWLRTVFEGIGGL